MGSRKENWPAISLLRNVSLNVFFFSKVPANSPVVNNLMAARTVLFLLIVSCDFTFVGWFVCFGYAHDSPPESN